jgi:para-nitrobenzyl esterase
VFGFLRLPGEDLELSGNQGLLDLVEALKWVQREVGSFGGDPGRITIFGESAGGVAVSTLLGFPLARGLFQRAVVQSGNAALLNSKGAADELASRFASILGVNAGNVAALRAIPAEQLLAAQIEAVAAQQREAPTPLPISPNVDGVVMETHPLLVPPDPGTVVMAGVTRDEYGLFNMVDPAAETLTRDRLLARVRKRLDPGHPEGTDERVVAAYEESRQARGEENSPGALWVAIETDRQMRYPIAKMLQRYGRTGIASYSYVFEYESPYEGGRLGACHTLELPFIFGNHRLSSVVPYTGGAAADSVARVVQAAWTGLARRGIPAREEGDWPEIGDQADITSVALAASTTLQRWSDRPELAIWDELQAAVPPTVLP